MIYRDSVCMEKLYQENIQANPIYQEFPYVSKNAFLIAHYKKYVGSVIGFGYKYGCGVDLDIKFFPCKKGIKLTVSSNVYSPGSGHQNIVASGQCMEELKELFDNHYFKGSAYDTDAHRYKLAVMKDQFYIIYNLWKKYHLGAILPKEMFLNNNLYQDIGFDDCQITPNDTYIYHQIGRYNKSEIKTQISPYKCEKSIIDFDDLVLFAHFMTSDGKEILEPGERIPDQWKTDTIKALNYLYELHYQIYISKELGQITTNEEEILDNERE